MKPYGRSSSSSSSRSGSGPRKSSGGKFGGKRTPGRGGPKGSRFMRKKINRFYTIFPERTNRVDYKDTDRLSKFLTEKGKILPRRISGLTAKQQRRLTSAIKRARHAGLLAFRAE